MGLEILPLSLLVTPKFFYLDRQPSSCSKKRESTAKLQFWQTKNPHSNYVEPLDKNPHQVSNDYEI